MSSASRDSHMSSASGSADVRASAAEAHPGCRNSAGNFDSSSFRKGAPTHWQTAGAQADHVLECQLVAKQANKNGIHSDSTTAHLIRKYVNHETNWQAMPPDVNNAKGSIVTKYIKSGENLPPNIKEPMRQAAGRILKAMKNDGVPHTSQAVKVFRDLFFELGGTSPPY